MDFVEMLKSWDYPPLSLVLVDVASQGSPFPRIPSQSRSLVLKAHQDSSYDHSKESTTMQTKKKKRDKKFAYNISSGAPNGNFRKISVRKTL